MYYFNCSFYKMQIYFIVCIPSIFIGLGPFQYLIKYQQQVFVSLELLSNRYLAFEYLINTKQMEIFYNQAKLTGRREINKCPSYQCNYRAHQCLSIAVAMTTFSNTSSEMKRSCIEPENKTKNKSDDDNKKKKHFFFG